MITYLLFVGVSSCNGIGGDGDGGTNGSVDLVSFLNEVLSLLSKLLPLPLLSLVRLFPSLLLLSKIVLELFLAKAFIPIVGFVLRIPPNTNENINVKIKKLQTLLLLPPVFFTFLSFIVLVYMVLNMDYFSCHKMECNAEIIL